MNVAELSLCKELYELSGWEPEPNTNAFWWMYFEPTPAKYHDPEWRLRYKTKGDYWEHIPAYDLGYLLRKVKGMMVKTDPIGERGTAIYIHFADDNRVYEESANTPEDAACKLAIELLKQGVQKESGA